MVYQKVHRPRHTILLLRITVSSRASGHRLNTPGTFARVECGPDRRHEWHVGSTYIKCRRTILKAGKANGAQHTVHFYVRWEKMYCLDPPNHCVMYRRNPETSCSCNLTRRNFLIEQIRQLAGMAAVAQQSRAGTAI